ncbi:pirin family protein [Salegentibacter sp. F188]|uniref:Pirin family protein n=1 Tax=Autumnicola patrickiae TaxID=3075591 RepID=A0ABU3E3I5_9FLAO|nr:pirin family protein [Salegentibacter sp. F188]MDT0690495.1 pirin family protein [Salegentibacter sp. F188]
MRSIKQIHKAEYRPISDLITYSPMPTGSIQMIDPFLFLNHHGPQQYPPNNNGLPFGPHPHRGMETVTFILDGDIAHKDSGGHKSVIENGGVQWMTAGSGLLHAEVSSEKFKKEGGDLEILQLWVNLPAEHKMTEPKYVGFQRDQIPTISLDNGKVTGQVVSGSLEGTKGAFNTFTDVNLATLNFEENAKVSLDIPKDHNIFFYVIKGEFEVNGEQVKALHLAEFNNDDEQLEIEAKSESTLLLGHAKPFDEPVVARGPFVMNTMEEIDEAYADFQTGKMGAWKE